MTALGPMPAAVLDELIARYGQPAVSPTVPEGVYLDGDRRWAWAWFPRNVNHGLHIDKRRDGWEVRTWIHDPSRWVKLTVAGEPTEEMIRQACVLGGLL